MKIIKVPILRLSPEWEPFFEIASISEAGLGQHSNAQRYNRK